MKLILFVAIISLFLIGCGSKPAANNSASPAVNAPANNANNPVAVTTPTPPSVTNDAPTLTPVYQGFCAAYAKKDEAGIRKAYSADTLKNFEEQMKEEKIPTLVKFLEDDDPKGKCSVKNEAITGDRAVAEIVSSAYPNGFKVLFVKENGEWKMTNKSPTFDEMKQSAK